MVNIERNHMPIYGRKTTRSMAVGPQTRPRTLELEMALSKSNNNSTSFMNVVGFLSSIFESGCDVGLITYL